MELLLITSRWPNNRLTEFLDDEIIHLSRKFNRIVVAPMRPDSSTQLGLPGSVVVDLSLAQHLLRVRGLPFLSSRKITGLLRAASYSGLGLGVNSKEFLEEGLKKDWIMSLLRTRADATSVWSWAKQRKPPDIAYTFWLGAATAGLRKAWPSIPIVSRVHGGDLFSEARDWQTIPFQSNALASSNLVASVSDAGRDYLTHKHPSEAAKVVVRRLGVKDCGVKTVLNSKGIRILSVSMITENKRVALIAEVALNLARSNVDVVWTHLGDGPKRSLIINSLSSSQHSLRYLLPGQVSNQEVQKQMLLGDYNIFVNLSLSEGAPVSMMEAQSMGLPIVATDVGGVGEVVPKDLNEIIRVDASVEEITNAILRAIRRPQREISLRRSSWNSKYNERMNYSEWAKELFEVARNLETR